MIGLTIAMLLAPAPQDAVAQRCVAVAERIDRAVKETRLILDRQVMAVGPDPSPAVRQGLRQRDISLRAAGDFVTRIRARYPGVAAPDPLPVEIVNLPMIDALAEASVCANPPSGKRK